jgi:hypothetical protein
MPKRLSLFLAATALAVAASGAAARPAVAPAPELLRALPPGDIVATVDVAMLFDKAIPAVLAGRPESKAKLDANVAKLRSDFGLDLHQVRRAGISASLLAGARTEWVAVLDGAFDAIAAPGALARSLDEFAKREPRYAVRADSYEGATIYVIPEKLAAGGTAERSAVAVLDARTALYGTPEGVRRAVAAHAGKTPNAAANAVLVEAYEQSNAASPVRFGMTLDAFVKAQREADPNDPFLQTLSSVRYMFGSLGLTGTGGVALRITSRASKPEDARSLLTTLQGLVDLGRSQTADKPEFAALFDLLTVTASGSDVVLAADIPPDRLDTIFRLVDKNRGVIAAQQ